MNSKLGLVFKWQTLSQIWQLCKYSKPPITFKKLDLQNTPKAPEHNRDNRFYVEAVNFLSGKDESKISTFPLSAEILVLKSYVFFHISQRIKLQKQGKLKKAATSAVK